MASAPSAAAERERLGSRRLGAADLVVLACLAAAAGLAWLWLASAPAGMGDSDSMAMDSIGAEIWSASYLLPAFVMWLLMMAAMMLPSAAPMVLLHARVARQPGGGGAGATAAFALAYLAVWAAFSAAAALAQALLVSTGAVSATTLAIGSEAAAALLLLLAAIYQLAPLKRACLDRCRSPLSFVARLWRPGTAGAIRLGLAHGAYCLGCCWALMLLLFVGGAMNLAWIAALALVVFVEKLAPASWRASRLVAALLVAGAVALVALG